MTGLRYVILAVLLILATITAASGEVSDTNLVAYYNFSSSTLADETNTTGPLTNAGMNLGVTGVVDEGADAEYTAGDEYLLTKTLSFTSFTYNVWVNPESYSGYGTFIGDNTADKTLIGLHTITTGELGFFLGNGADWCDTTYSSTSVPTGGWHMLTFTYDGTTKNVYLDGNPIADQNITQGACSGLSWNNNLRIGIRHDGNDAYQYDGVLDEVAFFTTALNTHNVTELYNSGAGLFYPFVAADKTPSIISYTPNETTQSAYTDATVEFSANVTETDGDAYTMRWSYDGEARKWQNSTGNNWSYYNHTFNETGVHLVTLDAWQLSNSSLNSSVTWTYTITTYVPPMNVTGVTNVTGTLNIVVDNVDELQTAVVGLLLLIAALSFLVLGAVKREVGGYAKPLLVLLGLVFASMSGLLTVTGLVIFVVMGAVIIIEYFADKIGT